MFCVWCDVNTQNSVISGECLDHMEDENMKLLTFPVKVEDDGVFLDLPPIAELDQVRILICFLSLNCPVSSLIHRIVFWGVAANRSWRAWAALLQVRPVRAAGCSNLPTTTETLTKNIS